MRFFALSSDLQTAFPESHDRKTYRLKADTSPTEIKKWFFQCLRRLGDLVLLDEKLEDKTAISSLFKNPECIFIDIYGMNKNLAALKEIPKRTLRLSHCSFLMPETLFSFKDFLPAQVNLVYTDFEKERIKTRLGRSAPEIEVFTPKVDTDFFCLPDKKQRSMARKKRGLSDKQVHIVYAGRWVVTKGIPQLIRALEIWRLPNAVVTLVGNFEPDFPIYHSIGSHNKFASFLRQECLSRALPGLFSLQPAKKPQALRELFWSADLFVNASVHPDEAFGITPRQAASCGVPVLTTDFCGLKPLADNMPWGGLATYPTFHGSRFSLSQFNKLLTRIITESKSYSSQEYRKAILKECDPLISRNNLGKAIQRLKELSLPSYEKIRKMKSDFERKVFKEADEKIVRPFFLRPKDTDRTSYMYAGSPNHPAYMQVQGMYSTQELPPRVETGSLWRGFFRIGIWEKENTIMEFGFPGPRMRRYNDKGFNSLISCSHIDKTGELIISPKKKEQVHIVQELVDYGFLVPEV